MVANWPPSAKFVPLVQTSSYATAHRYLNFFTYVYCRSPAAYTALGV